MAGAESTWSSVEEKGLVEDQGEDEGWWWDQGEVWKGELSAEEVGPGLVVLLLRSEWYPGLAAEAELWRVEKSSSLVDLMRGSECTREEDLDGRGRLPASPKRDRLTPLPPRMLPPSPLSSPPPFCPSLI